MNQVSPSSFFSSFSVVVSLITTMGEVPVSVETNATILIILKALSEAVEMDILKICLSQDYAVGHKRLVSVSAGEAQE